MRKEEIKVLIACEESQATCIEMGKRGYEAYSCDIQECSGGHPEWHIWGDALKVINGKCTFHTMDGNCHKIEGTWDLLIAHPPCTHLAVSGACWFSKGIKPYSLQDEAAEFFMKFINSNAKRIAVENPVSVMSTRYRKPDQIINPWQFGHMEQKRTCLWLINLPKLKETDNVYDDMMKLPIKIRQRIHYTSGKDRSKIRSKTFPGIAKAFADQWGAVIEGE